MYVYIYVDLLQLHINCICILVNLQLSILEWVATVHVFKLYNHRNIDISNSLIIHNRIVVQHKRKHYKQSSKDYI